MKLIFTFVFAFALLLIIRGGKIKQTAAQKAASQAARQATRLHNQAQALANSNLEASLRMGRAPSPVVAPAPYSRVVEYNNGGKIKFTQQPGEAPKDMYFHPAPVKVLSIPSRDLPIALVPRVPAVVYPAPVAPVEPVAGPSGISRADAAKAANQARAGPRATAAAAAIAAKNTPSVSLGGQPPAAAAAAPSVTITFGVGRREAAAVAAQRMGPRALAAAASAAGNKSPLPSQ